MGQQYWLAFSKMLSYLGLLLIVSYTSARASDQQNSVLTGHNSVEQETSGVTESVTTEPYAAIDPQGCGGVLNMEEETLISPNYPMKYPANLTCEWQIRAPSGVSIELTFYYVDIEYNNRCRFDYVEIRDGQYADSPMLDKLCGSRRPTIRSNSNIMYLKFVTDHSIQRHGFVAFFKKVSKTQDFNRVTTGDTEPVTAGPTSGFDSVEQETSGVTESVTAEPYAAFDPQGCGGVLNMDEGMLISPYFPMWYPANLMCEWQIRVTSGFSIKLKF